jgi:hypothetical protein
VSESPSVFWPVLALPEGLACTCTVSTVDEKHCPILAAYFATHLMWLKSPMNLQMCSVSSGQSSSRSLFQCRVTIGGLRGGDPLFQIIHDRCMMSSVHRSMIT